MPEPCWTRNRTSGWRPAAASSPVRPDGRTGGGRCPPVATTRPSQQGSHETGVGVELELALPLHDSLRRERAAQPPRHRGGVDPVVDLDEHGGDRAAARRPTKNGTATPAPALTSERWPLAPEQQPERRARSCGAVLGRLRVVGEYERHHALARRVGPARPACPGRPRDGRARSHQDRMDDRRCAR